jgi:hypothetical protein
MTLIENRLFSSFEATTEFSFSSAGLKLRINKLSVLKSLRMHFRLSVQLRVSRILLSLLHLQLQRLTSCSSSSWIKNGFQWGFLSALSEGFAGMTNSSFIPPYILQTFEIYIESIKRGQCFPYTGLDKT